MTSVSTVPTDVATVDRTTPMPSNISGALQAAARSSGDQGGCSDLEQTGHDRASPSAAEIDAVLHQKPRPICAMTSTVACLPT